MLETTAALHSPRARSFSSFDVHLGLNLIKNYMAAAPFMLTEGIFQGFNGTLPHYSKEIRLPQVDNTSVYEKDLNLKVVRKVIK
jgi:hypothetical protein